MTDQPNATPGNGIKKKFWKGKKLLFFFLAMHLVFTLLDACVLHGPCADSRRPDFRRRISRSIR